VLVFIDGAREVISAERAAEVDATLDLIAQAMGDTALPRPLRRPRLRAALGLERRAAGRADRPGALSAAERR
jgi:hypothetical protein